jgi:aspartate/methionine/tyrosine aminotransferase
VSTPVQCAAARLMDDGAHVRVAIQARLERNLASLQALVAATPEITLFAPEGGWSAVVRVPAILSEEQFVLRLLAEHGVLLHPGYFFDIDGDGFLVTSLLPEPAVFDEGLARLGRFVSGVTV